MSHPGGSTARIACQRCHANSFHGAATCWKCGASLPPPEEAAGGRFAVNFAPGAPDSRPPQATGGAHTRRRLHRAIAPVLAALILVGCAAVVAIAWRRHAAPPVERTTAELNRIKDRLMRERSAPAPASYTGDPDSVESRAQRELRRLQSQLDQTPYADPGADVRLRSGDRMSRVEYDRLRRGASEAAR